MEMQKFEFRLDAPVSERDAMLELGEWIKGPAVQTRVVGESSPTDERGQPMDVMVGLLAILGTKAVVEAVKVLAQSIHVYIEARRPKLTLTVTRPDGSKVTLDLKNPQSVPELEAKILGQAKT